MAVNVSWYAGPGSDNVMHRMWAASWERLAPEDWMGSKLPVLPILDLD